jgi:DNA-binding transcriptional MerR regulator
MLSAAAAVNGPDALDGVEERAPAGGLLQVGDLAKATGKTVRAIHLYEDLGLIEAARRSPGRYRLFSTDAKVRVRWISKLQSLGLSLTEIQAIVQRRQSSESARRAAQELRQVYGEKLADVREKLREYLALEQELEASVTFLDGCQQSCSAGVHVPGCSSCSRRMEPVAALPDLVVGAQLGGPN